MSNDLLASVRKTLSEGPPDAAYQPPPWVTFTNWQLTNLGGGQIGVSVTVTSAADDVTITGVTTFLQTFTLAS